MDSATVTHLGFLLDRIISLNLKVATEKWDILSTWGGVDDW